MNIAFLIDAIVRQTTVLIAQLATSGGVRAPLAHVANQVFLELAKELESQGIGKKVSADMFGLALRSYRRKVQRLQESSTERGRTLWGALIDFIAQRQVVSLSDILHRFHIDGEELIRGILRDMTESGLIFRSGSGWNTLYRMATDEDLGRITSNDEGRDQLVWISVFRQGEMTREALLELGGLDEQALDESLERLVADGRLLQVERDEGTHFASHGVVVPLGAASGWEAAVFDHFQAMIHTITSRLRGQPSPTSNRDLVGGSTYSFDVWDGHPMREDVLSQLARLRGQLSALRHRVGEHNAWTDVPEQRERVTFYLGQHIAPTADEQD